ncbi:HEPN domain-containing protein [Leptolyngbya sp. KIOST-1]|uniref:HEPN domain-containing protein n=1 Tax=Leptolyngbya sp. KIOST-1 TaxID=1229172 RepID=UPI00055C5004|nr:HEPN domain-containing protein [Leptolyngbya sp. KIOST-1]
MTATLQEWIDKAEADFGTAGRELQVRQLPNYDAVCFHTQQCVEKYLKARLLAADIPFPKIHDLTALLTLLNPVEPEWERFRPALALLTDFAVEVRYPGFVADQDVAIEMYELCAEVRQAVRQSLGLP